MQAGQARTGRAKRLREEVTRSAAERSRAEYAAAVQGATVVEIYDGTYQLRGPDPAYIEKLASLVDDKMRAVAAQSSSPDSLRVAVLAALNITDELLTLRAKYDALTGSMDRQQVTVRSRAGSLMGMLDEVLAERKVG